VSKFQHRLFIWSYNKTTFEYIDERMCRGCSSVTLNFLCHCKFNLGVISRFFTLHFLLFKKKNPKNSKNNKKYKQFIFDVFVLFLAFSMSLQNNLKFKNLLLMCLTYYALISKSLIYFYHWSVVFNIALFKKKKKQKIWIVQGKFQRLT
jgi:hypothetical protein